MWSIYTLSLPNGHVYVGQSKNPLSREEFHETHPVLWVQRHGKPVAPLRVVKNNIATEKEANMEEDYVTLTLMWHLGVNMVRGGQYAFTQDDYTMAHMVSLRDAIAHTLRLNLRFVEERLRREFAPFCIQSSRAQV